MINSSSVQDPCAPQIPLELVGLQSSLLKKERGGREVLLANMECQKKLKPPGVMGVRASAPPQNLSTGTEGHILHMKPFLRTFHELLHFSKAVFLFEVSPNCLKFNLQLPETPIQ